MGEPHLDAPTLGPVKEFLLSLQEEICAALEKSDGKTHFRRDEIERPGGGCSRPWVMSDGAVLERAAVSFTHTTGARMPSAATKRRPELTGRRYEVVSVSLIVHPRNPYAPTSHANFRFFMIEDSEGAESIWWFAGGFDLTPYYGFEEDAIHWHRTARAACVPYGEDLYPRFKKECDEYFYLKHRGEPRGIGGIFFDDLCDGDFKGCHQLWRSAAEAFLPAYLPLLERRKATPYTERERDFQLYRRGRYVEFNLIYDRGTRFGIETGARVESLLASLPPLVAWRYDWSPEPGTPEARLYEHFLAPRDWAQRSPDLRSS